MAYKRSDEHGGRGGSPFDDNLTETVRITRVSIRHGRLIDAIQTTWETTSGETVTGPRHGGGGGRESHFDLAADEYITRIEGRSGALVDQLTFITNHGHRHGPYGGNGGNPFTIDHSPVGGFIGRSGALIDAIGVFYAIMDHGPGPDTQNQVNWQQISTQKLQPAGLNVGDNFGNAVAVSGNTAIIGAYRADAPDQLNAGAAYIYQLSNGQWTQQQKLQPSDLQSQDLFGWSVAISGERAIVGAYMAETPGQKDAGAAYIYQLSNGQWTQQQKLQPSDLLFGDYFGRSVAISGDTAIIGAEKADASGHKDAGAAYVFKLVNGQWTQQQKLQPADLQPSDAFGISVAMSGDTAIIGANSSDSPSQRDAGAAYIFKLVNGQWTQQQKLQPADLQRTDRFGNAVGISGDLVIAGANWADGPSPRNTGAAYIFQLVNGQWTEQQRLRPDDLKSSDLFGTSVAISGQSVIVGADKADAPDRTDAGAAYIFQLVNGQWTQQQKLQPADLQKRDRFGYAVTISDEVAMVGAYMADAPGQNDAGAVYVVTPSQSQV